MSFRHAAFGRQWRQYFGYKEHTYTVLVTMIIPFLTDRQTDRFVGRLDKMGSNCVQKHVFCIVVSEYSYVVF